MYRTDFWTLWEKARVGCFKRTASKHVYYLVWNRSPAQAGCMRQVLRPGALGRPRGIGWRGRREGGSGWGTHVNPCLIHFNVWQNPLQCCKVIMLITLKKKEKKANYLKKKKLKKKKNKPVWIWSQAPCGPTSPVQTMCSLLTMVHITFIDCLLWRGSVVTASQGLAVTFHNNSKKKVSY